MLTDEHRAEHVGFEPTDAVTRINALAVRPNRPLWQCSARHSTGFIRYLQRRGQPIYGLTCPMRSRRGSNPLIPFRGLTCVPSMRLTVRPLLPVGRAVAPVEDVCRARPSFRSVLSISIRGMRSVTICPLRSRRGSNPLIPSSGTRRFSRPVPYRSATAPRQAYRRPSRRFEAISPFDVCARRSHSDSNRGNRSHGSTVFKTAAFSRSAMTPLNAHPIRLRLRIICACQCAVNGESYDFFHLLAIRLGAPARVRTGIPG